MNRHKFAIGQLVASTPSPSRSRGRTVPTKSFACNLSDDRHMFLCEFRRREWPLGFLPAMRSAVVHRTRLEMTNRADCVLDLALDPAPNFDALAACAGAAREPSVKR